MPPTHRELIACDVDESQSPLLTHYLHHYNSAHNTKFTIDDFHTYNWDHVFNCSRVQAEQAFESWAAAQVSSGTFPSEFYPGVEEAFARLREHYTPVYVTDRHPLLAKHTLELGARVSVTPDRIHLPREHKLTKVQFLVKYGIRKLIDDHEQIAWDAAQSGIQVAMIIRPWNEALAYHPHLHSNIYPVLDFAAAVDHFIRYR